MKKTGILNAEISAVVAEMGHKNTVAVVDAGFPISHKTKRIDLALKEGVPALMEVLENIMLELSVEEMILAEEAKEKNRGLIETLKKKYPGMKITYIRHEELKKNSKKCSAVVRTGEFKPYANIILCAGVIF